MPQTPKIAIVYDWVTTPEGGAEKVLVALHQAFPEAKLLTSVANLKSAQWACDWPVTTSFLQKWSFFSDHHRRTLPLLPLAFESLDLKDFDILISVTSAFAKGIITSPNQLHVCYLLTPPRFLYLQEAAYFSPLYHWLMTPILKYLRWWDKVAAWRPDYVIALSNQVSARSQSIYGRKVDQVIYPTIVSEIKLQEPDKKPLEPYFVVISRLVAYKRIDLALQACQDLELPLYIIGSGPERSHLENITSKPHLIHFLGSLNDEEARWYLAHAQALVMPGVEDFGITALEAASLRTPTVLQATSGVAEVIQSRLKIDLMSLDLTELKERLKVVYNRSEQLKVIHPSDQKYATTTFVNAFRQAVSEQWAQLHKERTS